MTILLCFNLFKTGVAARDLELGEVWKQLLQLPHVNIAVVMDVTKGEFPEFEQPSNVRIVPNCTRPTFAFWMEYMKTCAQQDETHGIIMNSDIIPSISFIKLLNDKPNVMGTKDCWALTRWNIKSCDELDIAKATLFGNGQACSQGSQDVWVFKLPIFKTMNESVNFFLGKWGCDNRFAHELKKHGYNVTNPCLSIKTYHLHNVTITREPTTNRIPPPYLLLPPCHLK